MPRFIVRLHNASAVRKNLTTFPFAGQWRERKDSVLSLSRGEKMWCATATNEAARQTGYPTEESGAPAASGFEDATLSLPDVQRASLDANQAG